MAVNIRKYPCSVFDCERTANVLTDDSFVALPHCLPCTRKGMVRNHIKRYGASVLPLAGIPESDWDIHGTLI